MTSESNILEALSGGLASAVERAGASTVLVSARRRIPASGVVWADGGVIVTADHVIEQDDDISLGLPDGREVAAQLAGRDPGSDLAVLRSAEAAGVPAAERAPEGATKVGHLVLAVGRPTQGGVQASFGAVGALGGPWRSRGGGQVEGFIRSDTTFYPGFSGGPLVDAQGRVAGINTSRFRPGQGLTIPVQAVARIVEALLRQGRIRRAYLGIGSQAVALPAALAERLDAQERGLLVVSVEGGSPAERAGLLLGDILVGADGAAVRDTEDLQATLGPERVGAVAQLRVLRGGEPRDIEVILGERA